MTDPSDGAPGAQLVDEPAAEAERGRRWPVLLGLVAVAMAIRMVMIFAVHPLCDFDADRWADPAQYQDLSLGTGSCMKLTGDSVYLYLQGRMLQNGDGLSDPVVYFTTGKTTPSGKKPPGVAVLIAGLADVGLDSPDAARVALAAMGSLAVAVLALAAWDISGRRAALIAGGLAAVSPALVTNDWRMLTEPMLALAFAGVVLFAYRLWARPSVLHAAALGACIGFGTYARFESLALLLALAAPLVFGLRWLRFGNRFQLALVVGLVAFAVCLPQVLYNSARFNNFSPFGPGGGWALKNATCDDAWYGEYTGYLSFSCFDVGTVAEASAVSTAPTDPPPDESDTDVVYSHRARTYIESNLGRFPAVAAARVGRVFGLYAPSQTAALDGSLEQRGDLDAWAALLAFAVVLPFAAAGAVVLFHRRLPLSPLVGAAVVVVVLVAASFGLPRYRVYLDVIAVVVAAVGVDALIRRLAGRRTGAAWWEPEDGTANSPSPAVLAGTRRATWDRWSPGRLVWGAVAVVVLGLVGLVAWSATLEPATPAGATSAEGAALCRDLQVFEQQYTQVATQPALAPQVLATVDRLLLVAPPELVQPLSLLRSEISAFLAAGGRPEYAASIGVERQRAILAAVAQLSDARAARC
ncbi:MAG: glycosyltransferase family 39 protein [Acidimicrobiales bacterium]